MATSSGLQPATPPPAGVTPNFKHPDSLFRWNVLCISVCLIITTTVMTLRSYVRLGIKKQWILEDWLCLVSWTGLVTYSALMTTTMHKHGGVHEWDITVPNAHEAIYWFNVTSIIYAPVILFPKLAILLLYRRVFVPMKSGFFDWAIRIFMTILIGFYLATALVKIWECSPRERIWNKSIPGTCIDVSTLLNISGLFNTITDIIILLVPVKAVWNMRIRRKRKMAIVLIFTVGLMAPVFSMISFIVRIKISANPDVTYNQPEILLWAEAEVSMGLICVCIPTLAPLARKRGPSRPSHSIINGTTVVRRKYYGGSAIQSTSLDDDRLFDILAAGHSALVQPPVAVVTGIVGGLDAGTNGDWGIEMKNSQRAQSREDLDRSDRIVATVRMEHSYV